VAVVFRLTCPKESCTHDPSLRLALLGTVSDGVLSVQIVEAAAAKWRAEYDIAPQNQIGVRESVSPVRSVMMLALRDWPARALALLTASLFRPKVERPCLPPKHRARDA
jgi:hypothetical protein